MTCEACGLSRALHPNEECGQFLPLPGRPLITDVLHRFAAKLRSLNQTHMACGGACDLQLEPWEWSRRVGEMQARLNLLAADGPSMPVLEALAAHVLAACLSFDEQELADPASGDEAAT